MHREEKTMCVLQENTHKRIIGNLLSGSIQCCDVIRVTMIAHAKVTSMRDPDIVGFIMVVFKCIQIVPQI